MKNQNSKIYPFVLVMMLFIFVSKTEGEYSMALPFKLSELFNNRKFINYKGKSDFSSF
jgi:hypothetical protein